MFKLNLPADLKEQAAIERRRRLEKERQSRIFNNKYRLIGIDKEALDQQVNDKKFIEELDQKRHDAYGKFNCSGSQCDLDVECAGKRMSGT